MKSRINPPRNPNRSPRCQTADDQHLNGTPNTPQNINMPGPTRSHARFAIAKDQKSEHHDAYTPPQCQKDLISRHGKVGYQGEETSKGVAEAHGERGLGGLDAVGLDDLAGEAHDEGYA